MLVGCGNEDAELGAVAGRLRHLQDPAYMRDIFLKPEMTNKALQPNNAAIPASRNIQCIPTPEL